MTEKPAHKARLYYLDNLKALLAVLVVLHHSGQPYGPGGSWWVPAEQIDFVSMAVLGIFFSVNAAFFMGLFFFVSAYFLPGSYDRKGLGKFLADRLVKLGVPIAIFASLVIPIMIYLLTTDGGAAFADFYLHSYLDIGSSKNTLSPGHLWFLVMLLGFSACYMAWRMASREERPRAQSSVFPGNGKILAFIAVLALLSFAVRIVSPINAWVPFRLFEPAHLPQYAMLFLAGILAYRKGWLSQIPAATAKLWSAIAVIMIVAFPIMYVVWEDALTTGSFTLPALAHSVWEALMCVSISIGLLALFQGRFNTQGRIAKALADNAFAVYLIHIPVIVTVQYLLMGVELHPLAKFAIVALIGVPASFLLSHFVVRKLPYAKMVL